MLTEGVKIRITEAVFKLGLGDATRDKAIDYASLYIERIGKTPRSETCIAGCTVYIASVFMNERRTQTAVDQALGLSKGSICRSYRKMVDVIRPELMADIRI